RPPAMRSFTDSNDQPWQAALLDASYGRVMLVFSPLLAGTIRRTQLAVENLGEAMNLLADLDEAGLRELLADAQVWDPASDGA
ncbi:hypothetical protein, partial [Dokdonella sp.]|uniref:hypothetical protein n=1 Tax=Dokdonella sp. TaxID=2291710 RepID=UPI0025BF9499